MAELLNLESSDRDSVSTLSELFDKCLELKDNVEQSELPSVSTEYQDIVKKAILMLESITHMVNKIGMFSSNESIEEVATSDVKFLLLPALLGYFNLKLQFTSSSHRLDQLRLSEEYYKDFLKRCRGYELPDVNIPEISDVENNYGVSQPNGERTLPMNLQKMAADRDAAIKRYKETRDVEKKLGEIKGKIFTLDEESKRTYYLLLLKRWILTALEELHTTEMEKSVVSSMAQVPPSENSMKKPAPSQPFKPMILVRTELQKKVFGAGYPSLPTMTVDEFYAQRYPDAENQGQSVTTQKSLQQMAADPDAANKAKELEEIEEEEKIEKDDIITLQKARAFDDWKDDNRRGSGNRKNMG